MLERMNTQPISVWRDFHNGVDNWLTATNNSLDGATRWAPAVDVVEEQDSYVLKADLPGLDRKDIEIVYENNTLIIKGERSDENQSEHAGYQRIERSYGAFHRTFRMPENIDAENISAKSEHGVLVVQIPKQEKAVKKIEVN